MKSNRFTARLLRASSSGFASMAASRILERQDADLNPDFDTWQAYFRTTVLELAAGVDDGGELQFAHRVGWFVRAFKARGHGGELVQHGIAQLRAVLEESLPSDSWALLVPFFKAAEAEIEYPTPEAELGEDDHAELARAYIERIRAGRAKEAVELVSEAIEQNRITPVEALQSVVVRALREIGRMWHSAALNVAEEHFATHTTGRLLERIVMLAPNPSPNGRSVLLTMVEGDAHDLGLRVVDALFELDGWRTICLGSNTPTADIIEAAEKLDPNLILIGATLNTHREAAERAIRAIKLARPKQLVVIGGPAFSAFDGRAEELGADGCALSPSEALRVSSDLLSA